MATFCLIKPLADAFKKALHEGKIDPQKLADMTSTERRNFFESIVGEDNAVKVNTLFEQKMLVKDFQRGMIAWAKEVSGLKPEVRRGIIDRIERLDERILNPADQKAFLEDLAAKKLGTEVTFEEAKKITEISKTLSEKKQAYDPSTEKWKSEEDRLAYGMARVEMQNFLDYVKDPYHDMKAIETIKAKGADALEMVAKRPFTGVLRLGGRTVKDLADLSVSMVATLDNSFLGRQGLAILQTHPTKWLAGAQQSYKNIVMEFGGKNAMDALRADIYSRPNAMNGKYELGKILDPNEEQFPSSFPEKIPGLGRVFKASESAFKGSALRMRADTFDLLLKKAEELGKDTKDKTEVQSIGTLVNSLTAKGSFGKNGVGPITKAVLWAPKMLKASFDVLTAHTVDYAMGNMSSFAYREAWKNLFKIAAVTATVLAIAKAHDPDSVETDVTSSDFGKIKWGNQRIDITGGKASLLTLAARLLTGKSKSSTSDAINEYGTGFGQKTRFDAVIDFLTNKVTPSARVVVDLLKGQTFEGKAPTLMGEIKDLYTPLPARNAVDFVKDPSWERAAGFVLDFHGFSGNNYVNTNVKTKLIPEGKNIKNGDFISMVKTYAEALGTDPETAFNRIFSGQTIRRVDNGAIIVERMSVKDSTAVKKKGGGNNPTMKLDHTIPLQLGGSNDESNLKLVPTSAWASYTPVENHLGEMLRKGEISKTEAQKLIVDFKNGKVKKEVILAK